MRMRRRGDALVSTGWMKTEFDAVAVIFLPLHLCKSKKRLTFADKFAVLRLVGSICRCSTA